MLDHVARGAEVKAALDEMSGLPLALEEKDRRPVAVGPDAQLPQHRRAIQVRQLEVQEDQVEVSGGFAQRFGAGGSRDDAAAFLLEPGLEGLAKVIVGIGQQDFRTRSRHGASYSPPSSCRRLRQWASRYRKVCRCWTIIGRFVSSASWRASLERVGSRLFRPARMASSNSTSSVYASVQIFATRIEVVLGSSRSR